MKIGVLGTGIVGQTIGSKIVQLGHEVMMGSRDEANIKATTWAKEEGPRASFGTFANAAAFGEIISTARWVRPLWVRSGMPAPTICGARS